MNDKKYDADEIRDLYDMNPSMTISDVSRITGIPFDEVKKILLEDIKR